MKYALPPSTLMNDNMGTTQTVNNPETNPRNRFLGVRVFKTRDYIRTRRDPRRSGPAVCVRYDAADSIGHTFG